MRYRFLVLALLLTGWSWGAPGWVSSDTITRQAVEALEAEPESLDILYRPAGIDHPPGRLAWETRIIRGMSASSPRVRVTLMVDQKKVQSWIVGFRKKRLVQVFVPIRDLPPGTLVTEEALTTETVTWDGLGTPATQRLHYLGKTARRYLAKGEVLRKRDLILRPVVERGERVVVETQSDGLTLSFEGVARQPGYPGRALSVEMPTGRSVEVWVDYEGRVLPLNGGKNR